MVFEKNTGSSQPNTPAGHYAERVTGRYFSIVARLVVSSHTTPN